jgi:hypothetical protein
VLRVSPNLAGRQRADFRAIVLPYIWRWGRAGFGDQPLPRSTLESVSRMDPRLPQILGQELISHANPYLAPRPVLSATQICICSQDDLRSDRKEDVRQVQIVIWNRLPHIGGGRCYSHLAHRVSDTFENPSR